MDRRDALKLGLGLAAATSLRAEVAEGGPEAVPILDAHIHLFDPTRAGGVPWPTADDAVIYKPALPGRYEGLTLGFGVVGAIAVEASPLESDNDWVLAQVAANPVMVGMVGNLMPGGARFGKELERLRGNPQFLGIRYGNLWGRDLYQDWRKTGFVDDLRRLAGAGLVLESANPDGRLIAALVEVAQAVPDLRIVLDHLPAAKVPAEAGAGKAYWTNLRELSQHKRVFVKLSEVPMRDGERVPLELEHYKPALDAIWEVFGEDRLIFGSDWPNSDHLASYGATLGLVRGYIATKGRAAMEKYFWRNSVAAYGWRPRRTGQRPG